MKKERKELVKKFENDKMIALEEQMAVGIRELAEKLRKFEDVGVIFLGDGVPVFKAQLEEKITVPYSFAPASCNRQRAVAIGVLAFSYMKMGKMEKAEDHMPDYLRLSQAERERKEEMERGAAN